MYYTAYSFSDLVTLCNFFKVFFEFAGQILSAHCFFGEVNISCFSVDTPESVRYFFETDISDSPYGAFPAFFAVYHTHYIPNRAKYFVKSSR